MTNVDRNILLHTVPLEYIQSRFLSCCNNITTFDYSALYTVIPNSKLKDRLGELVQLCFIKT